MNELVVSYAIDVACGSRTWSVNRRFSEFSGLHTALGREAPPAEVFSMRHEFGPVRGAAKRYQPALIEARIAALDAWLEQACEMLQYNPRLGAFLSIGSPDVDAYKRRGSNDPQPCELCAAGVPCAPAGLPACCVKIPQSCDAAADAAEAEAEADADAAFHQQPDPAVHGGNLWPHLREFCRSDTCSPDSVIEGDKEGGAGRDGGGGRAAQWKAAVRLSKKKHVYGFDATAAALAVELCRLVSKLPPGERAQLPLAADQ